MVAPGAVCEERWFSVAWGGDGREVSSSPEFAISNYSAYRL